VPGWPGSTHRGGGRGNRGRGWSSQWHVRPMLGGSEADVLRKRLCTWGGANTQLQSQGGAFDSAIPKPAHMVARGSKEAMPRIGGVLSHLPAHLVRPNQSLIPSSPACTAHIPPRSHALKTKGEASRDTSTALCLDQNCRPLRVEPSEILPLAALFRPPPLPLDQSDPSLQNALPLNLSYFLCGPLEKDGRSNLPPRFLLTPSDEQICRALLHCSNLHPLSAKGTTLSKCSTGR
jgi:hypothetical protein